MSAVSMLDLVGLRYKAGGTVPVDGVDCLWASRRALDRIFPDITEVEFPLDKAAAVSLSQDSGAYWEPVQRATKLGDVLFGDSPEPWVAVLVDPVGRITFTANRSRGTCLIYLGNLATPHTVLRRKARA